MNQIAQFKIYSAARRRIARAEKFGASKYAKANRNGEMRRKHR